MLGWELVLGKVLLGKFKIINIWWCPSIQHISDLIICCALHLRQYVFALVLVTKANIPFSRAHTPISTNNGGTSSSSDNYLVPPRRTGSFRMYVPILVLNLNSVSNHYLSYQFIFTNCKCKLKILNVLHISKKRFCGSKLSTSYVYP